MSDEPKKRRPKGWIGWAFLVLLMYPLSVGPVTALLERVNSPTLWHAYPVAYSPLWWASGSSESLTTLLIDYVFWWDPNPSL
ncbi:MAG TPA: hypothetical protein VG055_04420 [Planctomycetaceae bacterium]|jgi:hypothetical protein|nr:hypothetical protein [Planctomycetaceae bacterium]